MARLDRSLIAGAPAFAGLGAEALDAILAPAQILRLPRGEAAFRQGEPGDRFFLLLNGRLRVTRLNALGAQILVRFIAPNDMFGVAMAIGAATYPGTAVAAVESLALVWPNSAWSRLVAAYPSLAVKAMQALGARLQDSQDRLLELATQNVEQRIAGAVLNLARQAGRRTETGVLIDFPLSRQDLAEMTGATLHTVSRTLSAWEAKGLVDCGRQRVAVRDMAALAAIAGKTEDN
jgi:CRP-like cAMP-binding protein